MPRQYHTLLFFLISTLLYCKPASSDSIHCELRDAPGVENAKKFNAFALSAQPGNTGMYAIRCNTADDIYFSNPCPNKFQLSTSSFPVSIQTVYQPAEDGTGARIKIEFYFFRKNVTSVDISFVCKN